MKIELESTTKIIELTINGSFIPARIWEGVTESGIPVAAFIARISAPDTADQNEFERELLKHKPPSPAVEAIPLRLIS